MLPQVDDDFYEEDDNYGSPDEENIPEETDEEQQERPKARKHTRKSKADRLLEMLERERSEKNRFIQESNEAQKRYYEVLKQNEQLASAVTKDRESILKITEEAYQNDLNYSREINDHEKVKELEEKLFNIRYEKKELERANEQRVLHSIKGGDQELFKPYDYDTRPIPTSKDLIKDSYFEDFLAEHPYVDIGNTNQYSPELHSKVSELSAELSKQYALDGKKDKVMGKEYWQELSDIFREELSSMKENFKSEKKRDFSQSDPINSRRTVAPVRSTSSPRYSSRSTTSTLTEEQERFIQNAARQVKGLDIEDLRKTYELENRNNRNA